MSKKPLTATLIKAISYKVRDQLRKEMYGLDKAIVAKVMATKDWKEYLKLNKEKEELISKVRKVVEQIENKYSTPLFQLNICSSQISAREKYDVVSYDAIRNTLLIEEYLADDSETPDELIQRIVLKIKNG